MTVESGGKVCVIGLDGATFTVLDRRMAAGDLPNLRELVEEGVRGELMSTIPPVTGPAWTSMTTGVNPGQHGIYDFFKWPKDSRRGRIVRSSDCALPRIWDLAGQAGLRVGAYRVPVTYPAWPVNGFMVTGILSTAQDHTATHPPELWDELSRRGMGQLRGDNPRERMALYLGEKISLLHDARRTMSYLLKRFQPDLFMCVVSETDHVQHHLWDYCVRENGGADAGLGEGTRQFFREVDRTIGMLRETFGHNATFFVVSDHGFGPVRGAFFVNSFLAQKGFLKVGRARARGSRLFFRGAGAAKAVLRRTGLLGAAREALRVCLPNSKLRMGRRRRGQSLLGDLADWPGTTACALSSSDCGIHLNRRDRWTDGALEPGPECERVLQDLMGALEELKDPWTGHRAVSHMLRPASVHSGPYLVDAPDLLFALCHGELAVMTGLGEPVFGDYEKAANHRMEGVLVASGPGMARGTGMDADILDVAPTVLHTLGLGVPDYMEGRVLHGIFTGDVQRPVRRQDVSLDEARMPGAGAAVQEADETAVRQHLADLGYV